MLFYRTLFTEFNKSTEFSVMSGTIAHGILGFVSVAALVAVVSLPNWVSCHAALNGEWYEGMFAWSWKGIECDGFYFTAVDVADGKTIIYLHYNKNICFDIRVCMRSSHR